MLGSFGDIIFETSDKRLLNFEGFKRDTASVYENHKLIGQKPRTEFVAPGLDTVMFTVILRSRFGVKPRDEMNRWLEYARNGNAEILEIGGRALGVDKWVVTSTSQHWDTIFNRGELVSGKVDVTLQEYVSTMWTVKAYQERLKKLEAEQKARLESGNNSIYNELDKRIDKLSDINNTWNDYEPERSFEVVSILGDEVPKGSVNGSAITNFNNSLCVELVRMKKPRIKKYILEKLRLLVNENIGFVVTKEEKRKTETGEEYFVITALKYGERTCEIPLSEQYIDSEGIIDAEQIISDLKLEGEPKVKLETALSHSEGDKFKEESHTAIAFLLQNNTRAKARKRTMMASICMDENQFVFVNSYELAEDNKTGVEEGGRYTAGAVALVYTDMEPLSGKTGSVPEANRSIKVYYVGHYSFLKWFEAKGKETVKDPFSFNWDKSRFVTLEFKAKVIDIADKLKMNPDDLMAVMAFESNFDPAAKSANGSATGLIQFLEITAVRLGTTTSELSGMSAIKQLDYVYAYYQPFKGRMKNVGDTYLAVFTGGKGIGESDNYILYQSGSSEYEVNKGFDSDGKGYITRGDTLKAVLARRDEYGKK